MQRGGDDDASRRLRRLLRRLRRLRLWLRHDHDGREYLGSGAFRMCGTVAQLDRTPKARWQSGQGRSQRRVVRSGGAIGGVLPGTVLRRGIDEQMAAVTSRLSRTERLASR